MRILVALLAMTITASAETLHIENDSGGRIVEYANAYVIAAEDGDNIELSGFCRSACTLILRLFPRDRVCAWPGATLGFHAPTDKDFKVLPAKYVRAFYRETYGLKLAAWLAKFPISTTIHSRPASEFFRTCSHDAR